MQDRSLAEKGHWTSPYQQVTFVHFEALLIQTISSTCAISLLFSRVYMFQALSISLDGNIKGVKIANSWMNAGLEHLSFFVSLVSDSCSGLKWMIRNN